MSALSYLKDKRILAMVLIVVALGALDVVYGIHFGIEFVGGTEIPITLQHPVNVTAMGALISTLQQRVSTFGLKQVTVEGIGDTNVYVTIPTVSANEVNQTIGIIDSQGVFQAVVNGKEALNGTGILKGSIGQVPPQVSNGTVDWQVDFFITQTAANRFSKVVFGQGNQPEYLFLDRPAGAIVLINSSQLANSSVSAQTGMAAAKRALAFGSSTIPVITVSPSQSSIVSAENAIIQYGTKYKTIIASANLNSSIYSFLKSNNYTVVSEGAKNMTPQFAQITINETIVESWPAIGLLASPILSPSITNGTSGDSYEISGSAPQGLSVSAKEAYANLQSKTISSILNGGALPVSILVGTPTTVQPTLGSEFLYISGLAGVIAIALVSIFITIRYRKVFLVAPIMIITLIELFIIVSIIGLVGTIDLAAVAGMIAVVGTGVDAQIIITDETLEHRTSDSAAKTLLGNAFYIVWTDAALLIVTMLPLFFSTSLVTVVGFSESTIIGALLGVLVTRPAYSAIVSRHYSK